MLNRWSGVWLMGLAVIAAGCGQNNITDMPDTPTPTASVTVTPLPTASPTDTPLPSATPTPTDTATPTQVPIAEQLAAVGTGRYLGVMPSGMQQNGAWEEYTYDPAQEGPICLRGTQYQVNLRRGTSNNVLLYLEGGGACWNYATCWVSPLAKLTAGSATGVGVLEAGNPDNPFRDWNVVYASYCDGSVFAGDNIATYNGNRTYHHGLFNLSAAVTLMQREFPAPDRIVVSGSSAGGFGTYTGYGVTRVAFPDTPILVFDDSGPGLQNPADPNATAQRIANWHYTDIIPSSCTSCSMQLTYLTGWALDRDPTLRVAYFDYLQDGVLRFFLNLGAADFESLLRSVTGDVQAQHPDRFKRFFQQGELHTVLELPTFYTEELNGITVRDWTAAFLANDTAWQDLVAP
jgi:hypothetical protein